MQDEPTGKSMLQLDSECLKAVVAASGFAERSRSGEDIVAYIKRITALTVWYGSMRESNGRTNWTAILHCGDMTRGFTIARSEYPHRVRYAADCVRFLIGELDTEPFILDYDSDERTPCHLCGGSGGVNGKPCWGLNFEGPTHPTKTPVDGDRPDDQQ